MLLLLLAYLGGLLTILSPCILPILPFVFTRTGQPFRRSGLPLLLGMASTFALVSTLAVLGGNWAIRANQWGRAVALALLAFFGLSLIFPAVFERLTRPLVRLGGKIHADTGTGALKSFSLGIATGLLWAPCAGPILGLVLTAAAVEGASSRTLLLLLAYALGAGTSLALALLAGSSVLRAFRKYLGADLWVKRILGSAVLLGVLAISLGWDRGVLTRLSRARTESLEQKLVGSLSGQKAGVGSRQSRPELAGAVAWINSEPLSLEKLRGKVVLIDFWTYSCINCLRTLPYVREWARKYKDSGLVVVGVHTPEFAFEKDLNNVRRAVQELGITYPVAVDNNYAIWNSFGNQYWPAHYFIDRNGTIRHQQFGEGEYEESEKIIQALLGESQGKPLAQTPYIQSRGSGAEAPPHLETLASPETYLGYERTQNLEVQPEPQPDRPIRYRTSPRLELNQWSLGGLWRIGRENISLEMAPGKILFRFHARDLHLVLGPGPNGRPVRFVVRIDGAAPGADHGADTDASGHGWVRENRLYQLVRQQMNHPIRDRTFEIEFLDPEVQAYAFTFG